MSDPIPAPRSSAGRRAARRGRWLLLVLLLVGAGVGYGRHQYQQRLTAVGAGAPRLFQVKRGETVAEVGRRLAGERLIRDAAAFRRRARERELATRLQAGWYQVTPAAGVDAILDLLSSGKVSTRKVTFPEGLRLEEAAERCAAAGFGPAGEYRRLATTEAGRFNLAGLPAGATLEGYLFPDTYLLPMDAGVRELVQAQVNRFVKVFGEVSAGAPATRHSRHELVTIASLIEEEVRVDEERAKVAGVIENRLRRDMRLEFCSTVIYALGEHRDRLLYRDLRVDSPYNTYRRAGLPPGPIASPGRASLAAALRPARHDYLFYVLTADGRHLFSRTGSEHARAKAAGERARGD